MEHALAGRHSPNEPKRTSSIGETSSYPLVIIRFRQIQLYRGSLNGESSSTFSPQLTEAVLKQNAILAGLSRPMATEVLETGKLIDLRTTQQIYKAALEIREVYFPIDAVLSVVTQMREAGSIEVGTVGPRGSIAIPLSARGHHICKRKLLSGSRMRCGN